MQRLTSCLLVAVVGLSLNPRPAAAQKPVIAAGQASIVRVPGLWFVRDGRGRKQYFSEMCHEVRASPSSHPPTLLVAGISYCDGPSRKGYSTNLYAFTPEGRSRVRLASRREWDRAAVVSRPPRSLFPGEIMKGDTFEYRGHRYRRQSEHWGYVILSEDGRWLAVHSYSGKIEPGNFIGGGVPLEGDVYWDVYDSLDGKKVLSWRHLSAHGPATFSGSPMWVGKAYFIVPYGAGDFLIGRLPEG